MILLIILTVVMIIGAICQQNVAAIGYVGILIMTFLMMRYPFKRKRKIASICSKSSDVR